MSDMLGRSGPWEYHCCTRHSGRYRMTGKRMNEERQWRAEADEEMNEDEEAQAEFWTTAAVLKTAEEKSLGGSKPPASA